MTTTELDPDDLTESSRSIPQSGPPEGRRRHAAAFTVLVIGLVVTTVLVWTAWSLNRHNESRLLNLQGKQVGSVLAEALPSIQTPLELSAEAAQASGGDVEKFRQIMIANVQSKGEFTAASLWKSVNGGVEEVASVGTPHLSPTSARAQSLMTASFGTSSLAVIEVQAPGGRTYLGFALALPGTGQRFAVYGERAVPADRRATVASNAAFSDLNYAIYFGPGQNAQNLLTTDITQFPVPNPKTVVTVPFGNTVLTTVVTARTPLGGTLSAWLPWIFAILGVLLTLGAAWITERLVRRRRTAERATTEVRHLYGELGTLYEQQRSIAETLQRALLPQTMPTIDGLDIVARYVPGSQGVEIGGDWYTVVKLDDDKFFFAVGDVSGRGLDAAAIMARMRYTAPAYAFDGDSPARILDKSTSQLDVNIDGHFATALVGVGHVSSREVTMANAGHPLPLVLDGVTGTSLSMPVHVPLGMTGARYQEVTKIVPPGSTLIAFTDGLIERRYEDLDAGIARLHQVLQRFADESLDDLVTNIIHELVGDASEDDVAVLALRWTVEPKA